MDINYADVFTMKNEHSYAAFIGVLSNIYMKAHASSSFRTLPYSAALVINETMIQPYNNQPESSFDRLKAIISRMIKPKNGINLSIFLSRDDMFSDKSKIGLKHTISHCWSLSNNFNNKNIITINLPPEQLKEGKNSVRYFKFEDFGYINNQEKQFVDYDTPIEQVFNFFDHSIVHLCYQGGTAWISIAMGIPTIVIHPAKIINELHQKFKLYGQDLGNINILNNQQKIDHVRIHPSEYHIQIKDLNKILKEILK